MAESFTQSPQRKNTQRAQINFGFFANSLRALRETILVQLLLIVSLVAPVAAQSKTLFASPGKLSIREAISLAEDGDTILVKSGTYREGNIILKKSIVLMGENFPVLDGENKFEILTVNAKGAVISGLRFINTGVASINDIAAIKVLQSSRVRIVNNQFENTFFGIYLANSSDCRILNNQLTTNAQAEHETGNGIHLWKCDHMTIQNNRISRHRDGIYFEFVTQSVIENNYSEGNKRYGLHFMFSHNDEYRYNTFINNGAGVAVMYTKNVLMQNNTFQHNWGSSSYGLLLKDIRDSKVINNRFIENSIGIYMEGTSRTIFSENVFKQNGWAVKLQASCDGNTFIKNNFSSNTFDISTNGTLVLNDINGNYWDKYQGYDLDKDGIGDVPFRPVNVYAMIVERMPTAVMLWRSFFVFLLDRAEKVIPAAIPENLMDQSPSIKPI